MFSAGGIRLAVSRVLVRGLMKDGIKAVGVGPLQVPVATMKATHGEKYPYAEPWPYLKKTFMWYHEYFDWTSERFNENTKVIVVEGNVGVGKTAFARRLAEEFDLKVYDEATDDQAYYHRGLDLRLCDHLLPEGAQTYDVARFLADPKPDLGRAGRLQSVWYMAKYMQYSNALSHLFNTGQGVVIVRSPHSHWVSVEALKKLGWLSKNYVNYFYSLQNKSLPEVLKPHLTIYLDAPLDVIKKRIKDRNDPREANARNLTEPFLNAIDSVYKERFLPDARRTGEVLEIDWREIADDMDMDVIAEEIAMMKLESSDNEDPKFHDWTVLDEEEMCYLRRIYGDGTLGIFLDHDVPIDCPEVIMNAEEQSAFRDIILEHPALKYDKGWAPELGHKTMFRV